MDVLDGQDRSPHLEDMAKGDKEAAGAIDPREAKLAQALRANLKRRKAGAVAPPASKPDKSSTD